MTGFQGGCVQVANRVIDTIIALTASKVEGVIEVRGFDSEAGKLRRGYTKYIETEVEGDVLATSVMIRVDTSHPIIQVVEEVQMSVSRLIESMLGLACERVDVMVL